MMAENPVENVKYFDSQQPDERVILVIRRHILELLPTFLVTGLVYFVLFICVFILPFAVPSLVTGFAYNVYVLVVSLIALFNTLALFSVWSLHYLHISILTNEHFVEITQSGIFSRQIGELSLDKIQDVSSSQKGVFNEVFNIGTLVVETAGEAENFVLNFIPEPYQTSQKIMEIEEDYCLRHGIRGDGVNSNANQVGNHSEGNTGQGQGSTLPGPDIEFPDENPEK
jgi:membrane protein YdbS with pleckstrin-like domain